jgi:hypothetical protein
LTLTFGEQHLVKFLNFDVNMRGGGAILGRNVDVSIGRAAREAFSSKKYLKIQFLPQRKHNTKAIHHKDQLINSF